MPFVLRSGRYLVALRHPVSLVRRLCLRIGRARRRKLSRSCSCFLRGPLRYSKRDSLPEGSVRMPVVHVMGVRMRMGQRLMPVPVRVRHLLQLSWPVLMLVVLVVRVLMRVFQGLMGMPVLANVGAEQDCAPGHPRQRQGGGRVHALVEEYPREHPAEA